ncbi:hypothetical protein VE00_10751 [Pseudogymnoascus sp. WSF 3629]|nr:hypothetical protein VE00_10751 [Pseudogymnoascus sp. WSF 3629]
MRIDALELTRLETLLTEILHAVVDHLAPWEIKRLSYTSKRLRQVLFRNVKFEFSLTGIKGLKHLLESNVCGYIASFTYEITELLNPEILDFDLFRVNPSQPGNWTIPWRNPSVLVCNTTVFPRESLVPFNNMDILLYVESSARKQGSGPDTEAVSASFVILWILDLPILKLRF